MLKHHTMNCILYAEVPCNCFIVNAIGGCDDYTVPTNNCKVTFIESKKPCTWHFDVSQIPCFHTPIRECDGDIKFNV